MARAFKLVLRKPYLLPARHQSKRSAFYLLANDQKDLVRSDSDWAVINGPSAARKHWVMQLGWAFQELFSRDILMHIVGQAGNLIRFVDTNLNLGIMPGD